MVRKLKNIELNRLSVEEFRTTDKMNVVLVLDNIRSALNVGSIFRTADAFTVKSLYLCGITASPPNNELRKTALGAEESVSVEIFSLYHRGYYCFKRRRLQHYGRGTNQLKSYTK
jgi:23S rRNA (guanosine2251-2'-O)-methyltransferase